MGAKVSVCVPVYGVEKYIERCAMSLFEQTMTEGIEFIFVNDCTKDKSIEILERVLDEYPQRKSQVKIIHHEKNGGLVAARKTGLAHATGDYIIHCDSDDWVDVNIYEVMYNKAVETSADMVYCDYVCVSENSSSPILLCPDLTQETMLKGVLDTSIHAGLWNKMFRRNIAQDENLYTPDHICLMEDTLRVAQMLLQCSRIAKCHVPVFYYYRRGQDGTYTNVYNYSPRYFNTSCEIVDFLASHLPGCYINSLVGLKGNILFKCVIHGLMTKGDFNRLWYSDRCAILLCVHVIKRLVLLFAFIAYRPTVRMCQIMFYILCRVKSPIRTANLL